MTVAPSRAALTLKVFAVYLMLLGPCLVFVPNVFLALFGLPETTEVWIRVVGVTVLNIGIYYWYAAKSEAAPFFHASVWVRGLVFVWFVCFVVMGLAKPMLILFGLADLAGAIWTFGALRAQAPSARAA
jgi:hypothetical protein